MREPKDSRREELAASLARVGAVLSRSQPGEAPASPRAATALRAGFAVAGLVLGGVAVATGLWWLVLPGGLLLGLGAFWGRRPPVRPLGAPHIGLGATVGSQAVIEPGAVVEMGASVAAGAVIQTGAQVRWGASIGRGALIKQGATIHWGASVGRGAVVEEGATIHWGARVARDAVVEADAVVQWGANVCPNAVVGRGAVVAMGSTVRAGTRLGAGVRSWPGSTVGGAVPTFAQHPAQDERGRRIDEVCDRLQRELDAAPEVARNFLGSQRDTVAALRATCYDLLRRERALEAEASQEEFNRLQAEAVRMKERIEAETDATVKASLSAAVDAIETQKRERASLATSAARLEAERSRVLWTLESVSTQLVRLRSTESPALVQPELEASVTRLKDEIDAIAEALEEVQRPEPLPPLSAESERHPAPRERQRS